MAEPDAAAGGPGGGPSRPEGNQLRGGDRAAARLRRSAAAGVIVTTGGGPRWRPCSSAGSRPCQSGLTIGGDAAETAEIRHARGCARAGSPGWTAWWPARADVAVVHHRLGHEPAFWRNAVRRGIKTMVWTVNRRPGSGAVAGQPKRRCPGRRPSCPARSSCAADGSADGDPWPDRASVKRISTCRSK